MTRRWKVKLEHNTDHHFQLSVTVEGSLGDASWGWYSDEKIILLDAHVDEYSEQTVEMVKRHAHALCAELNQIEENKANRKS